MLDHQLDLQADFRRFYRLTPDECLAMPGPEYLALAWRVDAYGGVMAYRKQQAAAEVAEQAPGPGEFESSAAALAGDPMLADLIEIG